jgi:hypothetical protein
MDAFSVESVFGSFHPGKTKKPLPSLISPALFFKGIPVGRQSNDQPIDTPAKNGCITFKA